VRVRIEGRGGWRVAWVAWVAWVARVAWVAWVAQRTGEAAVVDLDVQLARLLLLGQLLGEAEGVEEAATQDRRRRTRETEGSGVRAARRHVLDALRGIECESAQHAERRAGAAASSLERLQERHGRDTVRGVGRALT